GVTVHVLRALVAALDARVAFDVMWRGGAIDRLLDERHASLVNLVVSILNLFGWSTAIEVSFNDYGDRGSIDVLAWHPILRTLLVIEVKSEITSIEELARRLDVKVRLARKIGYERAWDAARVAAIVVLPETTQSRGALARYQSVFDTTYPAR